MYNYFMLEFNELKLEVDKVLADAYLKLKEARDLEEFARVRNKAVNKLKAFFSYIPKLPNEQKPKLGQLINTKLEEFQATVKELEKQLQSRLFEEVDKQFAVDITAPWKKGGVGNNRVLHRVGVLHPLTRQIQRMVNIFRNLGFSIYTGKELDIDRYVFDYLNIPPHHPARESWDTFYTEEGYIPTTHTSNMQIRIIKDQMKKQGMVKAIVVGRTFRNEELDARHSHTFYQMEGVVVHKNASLGELLWVLKAFLSEYFDKELRFRILPAYFPFVEPGLEFAVECVFCDGKGCSTCSHKGWLEIVGAGMIHPVVLKNAGVDPAEARGYAWGFGIDRLVMLNQNVNDIRYIYKNDLNMLRGGRL